jgi:uncharacterized protein (DUF2147 family)
MLYKILPVLILSIGLWTVSHSQITGMWKVPDEHDGKIKSIVEIYEKDNKYQGRVAQVIDSSRHTHCENCQGDLKDQPLTGMQILYDLTITPDGGEDGKVLNPGSGKLYSCYIELESPDKLKLRGYVGLPALGKTIYWSRMK